MSDTFFFDLQQGSTMSMIHLIMALGRTPGHLHLTKLGLGVKIMYTGAPFFLQLDYQRVRSDRLVETFRVNLGGLFVLEPFISPALFQKYPGTVDEWTLSQAMAADTASGGLNQLEDHYNTFIVSRIAFISPRDLVQSCPHPCFDFMSLTFCSVPFFSD